MSDKSKSNCSRSLPGRRKIQKGMSKRTSQSHSFEKPHPSLTLLSSLVPTPLTRTSFSSFVFVEEKDEKKPSGSSTPSPLLTLSGLKTEVSMLRGVLRSQFSGKEYAFMMASSPTVSSSGAGLINSIIAVNSIASISEFASFAAIFDEFFVHSMVCRWIPLSRYQYQVGSAPTTNTISTLVTSTSLFHGASAYINVGGALTNPTTRFNGSTDPWTHKWMNNEDPKSGVTVSSTSGSGTVSQGWCLTAPTNAGSYAGQVQYLSGSGTFEFSTVIAQVATRYNVYFRCRA